jgi:hypothetical protein
VDKVDLGDAVFIADLHEAGAFAGREGEVRGHTKPSLSGCTPIIGAHKKPCALDLAWSVYFPDTGEQEWFAPHLVRLLKPSA